MNVIILDACRNNPFARSFRGAEQGLARMDAPTGSLMAYATAPGSVAADGSGRNGVYTKHLLEAMALPGLNINEVFMQVRKGVLEETRGRQTPWESSSLIGKFYFTPEAKPAVTELDRKTTRLEQELAEMRAQMEKLQQKPAETVVAEPDPKTRELEQELVAMREQMASLQQHASNPTAPDNSSKLEAELAAVRAQMAEMQVAMATPPAQVATPSAAAPLPANSYIASRYGELSTDSNPARIQERVLHDAGDRFVYSLAPYAPFYNRYSPDAVLARKITKMMVKRQDMKLVYAPLTGIEGVHSYTFQKSLSQSLWGRGIFRGPDKETMAEIAEFLHADHLVTVCQVDGRVRASFRMYIYERQTGEMVRYEMDFSTATHLDFEASVRKLIARGVSQYQER